MQTEAGFIFLAVSTGPWRTGSGKVGRCAFNAGKATDTQTRRVCDRNQLTEELSVLAKKKNF